LKKLQTTYRESLVDALFLPRPGQVLAGGRPKIQPVGALPSRHRLIAVGYKKSEACSISRASRA